MAHYSPDVVCVGILVADMFVPPIPQLPGEGELLLVDNILLDTGGCAANTGVDLCKLGASTAVIGMVGNDVFADFVRQDLSGKGLDVSAIRVSTTAPTARTVILPVTGQDRRYIHSVGANAEFGIHDIDLDVVAQSRVLYVGGFLAMPGLDLEGLVMLLSFARERGVKTVLDVAGVQPEHSLGDVRDALPYTDVFLPNDDEARLLTGESDPGRQAERFLEGGAGTVVVTQGSEGLVVRTKDQSLSAGVFAVNVVDPSGSGDAFDAGFIIGMLEGWDLARTITFASAIGAAACTQRGCTPGVFTREEAFGFISRQDFAVTEM
jgi:sugar/nucleoside kinase (ribokinase family)